MCGHLFPLICHWKIASILCLTIAKTKRQVRTAREAGKPLFLLPFTRLWLPAVKLTSRAIKDKPDQSSIINGGERRPDDNGEESLKETQEGMIGGEETRT